MILNIVAVFILAFVAFMGFMTMGGTFAVPLLLFGIAIMVTMK
tara:strand:+ start:1438 stop:1566 length:129 start_codon:yes stop_codon:yes gene_type:complete